MTEFFAAMGVTVCAVALSLATLFFFAAHPIIGIALIPVWGLWGAWYTFIRRGS